MSWLKVRKGTTELIVPSSSYKGVYEWQGYEIVADEKKPTQPKPTKTVEKKKAVVVEENENGTKKGSSDKPN